MALSPDRPGPQPRILAGPSPVLLLKDTLSQCRARRPRPPAMRATRKRPQWHFGKKLHIGIATAGSAGTAIIGPHGGARARQPGRAAAPNLPWRRQGLRAPGTVPEAAQEYPARSRAVYLGPLVPGAPSAVARGGVGAVHPRFLPHLGPVSPSGRPPARPIVSTSNKSTTTESIHAGWRFCLLHSISETQRFLPR